MKKILQERSGYHWRKSFSIEIPSIILYKSTLKGMVKQENAKYHMISDQFILLFIKNVRIQE